MPAGGAEIGTFLSYAAEKKLTKHPEEFGNGAIEGVAGPEAANNASAAGTLVPLLTLGLPTTATAAIMLAGFQQYRPAARPAAVHFQPAARLGPDRLLLVANLMLLVLNLPLIGLWVKLLTIPKPWLYAGILLFATLGTIGANPSVVRARHAAGLRPARLWLRLFGYPIAPVVVGLILGPMAEQQLAPGAGHQPGRRTGAVHLTYLGNFAGPRGAGIDRAADPQGPRQGPGAGGSRCR
jgi:putative tricarboxylic transport membrane protein